MDKVKITQEQADVIKHLKTRIFEKDIVADHVKNRGGWENKAQPLNELGLDTLIRALYIGYEVEETPEDKVRELYRIRSKEADEKDNTIDESYYNGICRGINECLEALNIKIEGVNA